MVCHGSDMGFDDFLHMPVPEHCGSQHDVEKRSRTEGEALDDFGVARISSFLKSYGEMRKGEQFVMAEVRARARERVRWGASLGLLAFALLLAPVRWRRLWARAKR